VRARFMRYSPSRRRRALSPCNTGKIARATHGNLSFSTSADGSAQAAACFQSAASLIAIEFVTS
jgi:hypothetical protein